MNDAGTRLAAVFGSRLPTPAFAKASARKPDSRRGSEWHCVHSSSPLRRVGPFTCVVGRSGECQAPDEAMEEEEMLWPTVVAAEASEATFLALAASALARAPRFSPCC